MIEFKISIKNTETASIISEKLEVSIGEIVNSILPQDKLIHNRLNLLNSIIQSFIKQNPERLSTLLDLNQDA